MGPRVTEPAPTKPLLLTPADRLELVRAIHDSPVLIVLAIAGGGNAAITDLLDVPGASRTILEIRVPYAATAMADLLAVDDDEPWSTTRPEDPNGGSANGAVSESTARTMAEACLRRARHLAPDATDLLGVACTAALVSDRPKKGDHRAHVAVAHLDDTAAGVSHEVRVDLEKGALDRAGEDRVVADAILREIGHACHLR